ncbi:MAG: putative quinol monooxygenase [Candidatus Nanopelagicales bacterium]|jgi:quinol monooxygenase YgiN|nr:antibiotic biosynthesis monooxygenase [Candidatus Nanopelagicales bacterium]MCF8556216.1 antibiotic biosynthesis monooxygenase [Candidatus Nanopelagicales bacterium]MDA2986900.1 putative quinol monooxygenase [Actinomycetota bacterium]
MDEDEAIDVPVQALLPGRKAMVVRLTSKPGMRAALLDTLNTYADGLEEEPGTEVYLMSLDPDDENLVWLFEVFKDEDAENEHRSAPGFATMLGSLNDLLEGPPAVLRMEPLRLVMQESLLEEDWAF